MKKQRVILFFTSLLLLLFATHVFAANSGGGWQVPSGTGLPDRPISAILLTFIRWATLIIGLLGVIVFIYGGFLYLTGGGDDSSVKKAKNVLTYGVIGIIVAVLGLVVVRTIDAILSGGAESGSASSAPSSLPTGSGTGIGSKVPGGTPPDSQQYGFKPNISGSSNGGGNTPSAPSGSSGSGLPYAPK